MLKPKPRFKVGQVVTLPFGIHPAIGGYIPAEANVTVKDVSLTKYGKGRADWAYPRYLVVWAGVEGWVSDDGVSMVP